MRKSNDSIPEDEMLLAEALAAAKARGLNWTSGNYFVSPDLLRTNQGHESAIACCAIGAFSVAWDIEPRLAETRLCERLGGSALGVTSGNDRDGYWDQHDADNGESLGWAFRCAMTQDEP